MQAIVTGCQIGRMDHVILRTQAAWELKREYTWGAFDKHTLINILVSYKYIGYKLCQSFDEAAFVNAASYHRELASYPPNEVFD